MHNLIELYKHNHLKIFKVQAHEILELFLRLTAGTLNTHPHEKHIQHKIKVHDFNLGTAFR